jgi:hypothetical protein
MGRLRMEEETVLGCAMGEGEEVWLRLEKRNGISVELVLLEAA